MMIEMLTVLLMLIALGILFCILIALFYVYSYGIDKGIGIGKKMVYELEGSKLVTLSNGKEVLISLENNEKNLFDSYINLKKEMMEKDIKC